MKKRILLSWIVFWILIVSTWAQGLLVKGIVKDKETRKALANVNVSVEGSNIGTVTNADGVFSLKVSQEELGRGVIVSHLGYQNVFLTSDVLNSSSKRPTVWMTPTSFTLDMVNVYGGNPLELVEKALRKIPQNYADHDHLFSAFYRETIQAFHTLGVLALEAAACLLDRHLGGVAQRDFLEVAGTDLGILLGHGGLGQSHIRHHSILLIT